MVPHRPNNALYTPRVCRRAQAPPRSRRRRQHGLPARHRGVLRRQPHLGRRRHLLRALPRRPQGHAPRIWYEDGAYLLGRPGQSMVVGDFSAVLMQYDDLAGAATNNIEARDPRTRRRRRRQGTGVSQRGAGPVPLSGQGPARAHFPHLQRTHRRRAGALRRPFLRRGLDQLVGPAGSPAHAGRAEVAWAQDVSVAAKPRQRRQRRHHRLRVHRDERGLGRDRGRPACRSRTTSARAAEGARARSTASRSR